MIPKQPRSKPASSENIQDSSKPDSQSGTTASGSDPNTQLQRACSSYLENVNSASLDAHIELAKAYLSYLETIQQLKTKATEPAVEYWKELIQARNDAQAISDAHKKFTYASLDSQTSHQKTFADAVTTYDQQTRDIWNKLQRDVGEHNQAIADELKEALLKTDVRTADISTLSLLYQYLTTMGANRTGNTSSSSH
jgi:hypothetical protein